MWGKPPLLYSFYFEVRVWIALNEGNLVGVAVGGLDDDWIGGDDGDRGAHLAGNLIPTVDKVPVPLDEEGTLVALPNIHGFHPQGASYYVG